MGFELQDPAAKTPPSRTLAGLQAGVPCRHVLAAILPLIGITGDIAFDGAEAVVGPVIIATMLLPYLVPPPLVRQIRAEGERARGF